MRPRTRSLALVGVLFAAGCAAPGLLSQPEAGTNVQAFVRFPGANPRPAPTPPPRGLPSRTPATSAPPPAATTAPATPTPSATATTEPATTAGGTTTDTVVYSTGQFLGTGGDTDRWAFSLRALQHPDGTIAHGQVIIASSIAGRNVTMFGEIKAGTVTKTASGGQADLTATLTTGGTLHVVLTDNNAPTTMDRVVFDGPNHHCDGRVYHGGVRILRSRPLSAGTAKATGYRFDSRIGLFIVEADAAAEQQRPDDACDARVVEVTRPDPLIDFRKNDQGGYVHAPGSDNNVP